MQIEPFSTILNYLWSKRSDNTKTKIIVSLVIGPIFIAMIRALIIDLRFLGVI